MNKKILVATGAWVFYLSFIIAAYAASTYLTITTTGTIIETFDLSAVPNSFGWGDVNLGIPVMRSTTLTNVGSATVSNLNMTTSDVVGLTNYTLTWDAEGIDLTPNQSIIANLTLTIYEYSATDFSLNIIIQGEP